MNAGVIGIAQQYGLSPDQTNIISNNLNELHALCKNLHAEVYYDVSTNPITRINRVSFNILFKTGFRMQFQNELPNYSEGITTNALLIMVANIRGVLIRLDTSLRVIYGAVKEYRNDNSIIDTPYHICAYIECIIKGSEEKLTSGQLARRWEDALINAG